jgi:hypothetical protein
MIVNLQRAESRTMVEIQRAETCELMLKLAGMVLTYHPVGYMIQKGLRTIAEHLVISQVEEFVANLEHQSEPEASWGGQRLLEPGPEAWYWRDHQRELERDREAGDFEAGY